MTDAVVLPGGKTGPRAPLLLAASAVAERRSARVHRHEWATKLPMPWGPHIEAWACGEVRPVLDAAAGRPLLIGKSLGSAAAAVAAERGLPAVWLTPLLTEGWVVAALERSAAPFLLIGGTADTWWDGTVARRLSPHVCEVEGADHDLVVPGPPDASIAVRDRTVAAIEAFLDAVGWPG
jgi:hypothetical protein